MAATPPPRLGVQGTPMTWALQQHMQYQQQILAQHQQLVGDPRFQKQQQQQQQQQQAAPQQTPPPRSAPQLQPQQLPTLLQQGPYAFQPSSQSFPPSVAGLNPWSRLAFNDASLIGFDGRRPTDPFAPNLGLAETWSPAESGARRDTPVQQQQQQYPHHQAYAQQQQQQQQQPPAPQRWMTDAWSTTGPDAAALPLWMDSGATGRRTSVGGDGTTLPGFLPEMAFPLHTLSNVAGASGGGGGLPRFATTESSTGPQAPSAASSVAAQNATAHAAALANARATQATFAGMTAASGPAGELPALPRSRSGSNSKAGGLGRNVLRPSAPATLAHAITQQQQAGESTGPAGAPPVAVPEMPTITVTPPDPAQGMNAPSGGAPAIDAYPGAAAKYPAGTDEGLARFLYNGGASDPPTPSDYTSNSNGNGGIHHSANGY